MPHTMTITQARDWVRQFARNAGDSSVYSDADIDRAIMFAATHVIDNTTITKRRGTTQILAGSASFEITENDAPGLSERNFLTAWLGPNEVSGSDAFQYELIRIPYASMNEARMQSGALGVPRYIAFKEYDTGTSPQRWRLVVYPAADARYTINIAYKVPFNSWTPGQAPSQPFVLDDDMMIRVCALGAPAILQYHEPEQRMASARWAEYMQWIAQLRIWGREGAMIAPREAMA